MLAINNVKLFSTVSFELYPAAILGTRYEYAKVLAITDSDTARFFVDPIAMHANVYPTLPASVPDAADEYPWVKLKLANGETTAIGLPWIKEETYVEHTTTSIRLVIENVEPNDHGRIREALAANGFQAIRVEVLN